MIRLVFGLLPCAICFLLLTRAVLADQEGPGVPAQPLLAQVNRLEKALDQLGDPLPPAVKEALHKLDPAQGDGPVSKDVQRLLDPLCLAAVEIKADKTVHLTPLMKQPELVEQGWRTFLIKVHNPARNTQVFRMESRNARTAAHAAAKDQPSLWLDIANLHAPPLLAPLSGLELEYRAVQLFSRERGEQQGTLRVSVGASDPDRRPGTPRNPGIFAEMPLRVMTRPATPVTFQVREVDGSPCMGCFEIRDEQGRVYPSMAKRLAPDFFFHPQVYRESGEKVLLPAGRYKVRCSRGPESIPEEQTLVVADKPVTVSYQVRRWIDPSKFGWWSGDHHIHAAGCAHYEKPTEGVHPPDMMRHILGEDLKVGCCLTWGPCFDYQKRFFSGRPDPVSRSPYLLRYDVEVSGFGSHQSGHLCLLRLKEQMYPGGESKNHWPTLGLNTLKWAKRQGAVCGPAHSGNGLTDYVGRVEGGQDGPHGLPNFNLPAYNGIGANEFIVDITHEVPGPDGKPVPAVDFISAMDTDRVAEWNMWYHALNAGFRVKVSGETDFPCIYGDRVGIGRVYCKLKGQPDYDAWCQAIADGRSYVSDGTTHLMDFECMSPKKVEMGVNGSEVRLDQPGALSFRVRASSITWEANMKKFKPDYQPVAGITLPAPTTHYELIINGYPTVARPSHSEGLITWENIKIDRSSWVAVRVFPHAHTNPIFVIVNDKPIRSKASLVWCLRGVDQCWKEKRRTYKPEEQQDAAAAYEHARQVYRQLLKEVE